MLTGGYVIMGNHHPDVATSTSARLHRWTKTEDFLKDFPLRARYPGMEIIARILIAAAGAWWRIITLQSAAAFELARTGCRLRRFVRRRST
jgi:hypothetical protein